MHYNTPIKINGLPTHPNIPKKAKWMAQQWMLSFLPHFVIIERLLKQSFNLLCKYSRLQLWGKKEGVTDKEGHSIICYTQKMRFKAELNPSYTFCSRRWPLFTFVVDMVLHVWSLMTPAIWCLESLTESGHKHTGNCDSHYQWNALNVAHNAKNIGMFD